jgi:hypothetical protein
MINLRTIDETVVGFFDEIRVAKNDSHLIDVPVLWTSPARIEAKLLMAADGEMKIPVEMPLIGVSSGDITVTGGVRRAEYTAYIYSVYREVANEIASRLLEKKSPVKINKIKRGSVSFGQVTIYKWKINVSIDI